MGLVFISPIFLLLSLALLFNNKGKIFFIQERAGKHGKKFRMVKFKTMNDQKDIDGNLLPDKVRLTKVGAFIRSLSLDELPQLFNILKGDMSLIGPRPLLIKYLGRYDKTQARRHEVRPGITGWAQVNGRNLITWEEKFELDIYYVDNISFDLDAKIFLKTFLILITREGINSNKQTTMNPFNGNN
jgi:lipopolysaccharide/colanic/teichoic acid biosynthesis glycosyltransferase